MPHFATRTVVAITDERRGLQRVALDDGNRAFVLTQLIGRVEAGNEVVVNTTAVDLDLGTGGWHVVHWNLARREWGTAGPRHIMKVRYTSVQVDTGAVEEDHAEAMASFHDLGRRVVVACGLHSQLAPVVLAVRRARPEARIAYVMTDGAALPLALSDTVHHLSTDGHLDLTITAGHAFGGDFEAVGVPSALAAAVVVGGADVIIAGSGPGVVGTGTRLGTSALEVAHIVDTCSALGGRPVVCARYSEADSRPRHAALSQQTSVALELARSVAEIPVPAGPVAADVRRALLGHPHRVVEVTIPDPASVLAPMAGRLETMGRSPLDDPVFFAVAVAAGTFAAVSAGG
ncbi:MAG: hypothetical protein QOD72_1936, partial [Acidimicrobiaceae bacterium]|nr:hypothetical protein [Acidimicrobiaceae bacterium]